MRITTKYIGKKLISAILVLLGISLLAFSLGLMGKGDPALTRLTADPNYIPSNQEIQILREEMGLEDSYLVQYGRWLTGVVQGDLGQSYINDKVVKDELLRLLPSTIILSVSSLILIVISGMLGGVIMVIFYNRFLDWFGRILLVVFISLPGFCLAYFMIWVFAQQLKWLPTSGTAGISSYIMPCIVLSLGSSGVAAKLLRSSFLGELGKNYILTARAKGLNYNKAIIFHGLRNSMIPFVTYIANNFGGLLGGTMIIESIFSIPGIGSYALSAIGNRDYIALQGYVLFTGFIYVLVSLVSDIICAYLNKQINLEG